MCDTILTVRDNAHQPLEGTIPQRYKSGNEKCHALALLTRVITPFQLPKIWGSKVL
jgi:hypothetical protein